MMAYVIKRPSGYEVRHGGNHRRLSVHDTLAAAELAADTLSNRNGVIGRGLVFGPWECPCPLCGGELEPRLPRAICQRCDLDAPARTWWLMADRLGLL